MSDIDQIIADVVDIIDAQIFHYEQAYQTREQGRQMLRRQIQTAIKIALAAQDEDTDPPIGSQLFQAAVEARALELVSKDLREFNKAADAVLESCKNNK